MNPIVYNLRDILEESITRKTLMNPQLSLRSISRDIGVSVTCLSDYLSKRTNISIDNGKKILEWLDLSKEQDEFLMKTIIYESSKNEKLRNDLMDFFAEYGYGKAFFDNELHLELFRDFEERERLIYYKDGTPQSGDSRICFRILVLLREKESRKEVSHFYEMFNDMTNLTSGIGYYYQENEGFFRGLLKNSFQRTQLTQIFDQQNLNLAGGFNQDGLPTVKSVHTKTLFTDERGIMNFEFTKNSFCMKGKIFDKNNDFLNPRDAFMLYKRIG